MKTSMFQLIGIQSWYFRKNYVHILLLIVFAFAGLYGLYQGYAFKKKQAVTINAFRKEKLAVLKDLAKNFDADTTTAEGKQAFRKVSFWPAVNWYTVLPAYKNPNSTSIYAIGQADVLTFYYPVKTESFFMQLFKQNEIANPLRSLAGHFDTSFWIVYLLPLLIIVLSFNILSSEIDNGNLKLIGSQGVSPERWVRSRIWLIASCAEGLMALVFITGMVVNYTSFSQLPGITDLLYFITAHLYVFLWLSILYLINAMAVNTSASALYAGVMWVIVCIVLPTLISTITEKSIPVDNTEISRISRRPQPAGMEDSTYISKLISDYKKQRPRYSNATITLSSRSMGFAKYMAYHELLDDTNAVAVQHYFKQIERRQQLNNASVCINPASAVDGILTGLAQNDAASNHQFIWQVKAFHQQFHDVVFPAVFNDKAVTRETFNQLPSFNGSSRNPIPRLFPLYLIGLVALIMAALLLAKRRFKKALML